jgi:mRNA interferase MazF
VPFPFIEQPRLRLRPALVIAIPPAPEADPLLWTMMITSAENAAWPGDISLAQRFAECGLPSPSLIRTAKIATTDASRAQALGRLPPDLWSEVIERLGAHLGF